MIYCRKENGRLPSEDADRLVRDVIATQSIEGIMLTAGEAAKLSDLAHGRITKAEYDAWLRKEAGI